MPHANDVYNSIMLLDKPSGITSHDAVAAVRRIVHQRSVGHTGTLDPLATGLLVICLGQATKMARFLSDLDKTYEAEICLGRTSRTYDSEGLAPDSAPVPDLTETQITDLLAEYRGIVRQKVPAYSAVKVNGEPLYRAARRGEGVELPERDVNIKSLTLKEFRSPKLSIEVTCSRGTYIRSLANDLGTRIGCGAYLSALKRTAVGQMTLANALTLDEIETLHGNGALQARLLGYDRVLHFGALTVRPEYQEFVLSGRDITCRETAGTEGHFATGEKIFIKNDNGRVLAIGVAAVASETVESASNETKLFNYIRVLK